MAEALNVESMIFDYLPSGWVKDKDAEYVKKKLDASSEEYRTVLNKFHGTTMARALKPDAIYIIMNPYIYGRFQLRKQEYQNTNHSVFVKELFHTTGTSNVESIITNNLDWRRVTRSKFGQGVSFSPCAGYANKECNRRVGSYRTAILCDVLVGSTERGYENTTITSEDRDTTVDSRGNVFVKYYDDEFCPKYLIEHIGSSPARRRNYPYQDLDFEGLFIF